MTGITSAGSYRQVLALPGARRIFGCALLGRLTYGLLPLSLLFTIRTATGSFGPAAGALAVFGAATITMPLKSRLIDRHGQRRTLLPMAGGLAILLVLVACLAASRTPVPRYAWSALALACGAAAPPLGPSMRLSWRSLCAGTALLPRAYALDAVCEELLYLVGPALVGILLSLAPAWVGLCCSAVLLVTGTAGMTAGVAGQVRTPTTGGWLTLGPLRHRGLRSVLAAVAVTGTATALLLTAVAGYAQSRHDPGLAGYLDAAISLGSATAGLGWARWAPRGSWRQHFAGLFLLLGLVSAVLTQVRDPLLLGALLTTGGMVFAPMFVTAYLAVDAAVDPGERAEAGTWVNTVTNLGGSLGTAVAGALIGVHDAAPAFAVAAVLLLVSSLGLLVGLLSPRSRRRRSHRGRRTT